MSGKPSRDNLSSNVLSAIKILLTKPFDETVDMNSHPHFCNIVANQFAEMTHQGLDIVIPTPEFHQHEKKLMNATESAHITFPIFSPEADDTPFSFHPAKS